MQSSTLNPLKSIICLWIYLWFVINLFINPVKYVSFIPENISDQWCSCLVWRGFILTLKMWVCSFNHVEFLSNEFRFFPFFEFLFIFLKSGVVQVFIRYFILFLSLKLLHQSLGTTFVAHLRQFFNDISSPEGGVRVFPVSVISPCWLLTG